MDIVNYPQWGATFPLKQLHTKPVHVVVIFQRRGIVEIILVFILSLNVHNNISFFRFFFAILKVTDQMFFGDRNVATR